MYRIIAFIFAGCIGFTGFTSYAQSQGGADPIEEMMRSMAPGGASGTTSDIFGSLTDQIKSSSAPTEQQTSAIEDGQSLVGDVETPNVNQTVVEIIDTRTGRYPPRLKVNFHEFPLRSLAADNGHSENRRSENGQRDVGKKTRVDIVVQRIQSRLRAPNIELVVEDRTAIISGMVATERQRNLAESMLRFEPGIDTVENKLTVAP
jgi:osmotically-inducible protein OsmY